MLTILLAEFGSGFLTVWEDELNKGIYVFVASISWRVCLMIFIMIDPLPNFSRWILCLLICRSLSWSTLLGAGVTIFAQIVHAGAEAMISSLRILENTGCVSWWSVSCDVHSMAVYWLAKMSFHYLAGLHFQPCLGTQLVRVQVI